MMRTSRICLLFVLLALSACVLAPVPPGTSSRSPSTSTADQAVSLETQTPETAQWPLYRNDTYGFVFRYPNRGQLSEAPDGTGATINFLSEGVTNMVEEQAVVSVHEAEGECQSLLARDWAADELQSQEVVLNGTPFLRQSRDGAAAGTSTLRIAYTTRRGEKCVSFDFVLSTFDPANLDPTRFPTEPARIDRQQELQLFETIASTFTWLE